MTGLGAGGPGETRGAVAKKAVMDAFCTPAKLPVNIPSILPNGSFGTASAGTMVSIIVPETFWHTLAPAASSSDGIAPSVRTAVANIRVTLANATQAPTHSHSIH